VLNTIKEINAVNNFNAVRCHGKKPPLIVKISSSLKTAIFDCRIYSN